MVKKIYNYYKVFGFRELIKKIYRFINNIFKYNYCGEYKFSDKEKETIFLKKNVVSLITDNPLFDCNSNIYKLCELLNDNGFVVNCYYLNTYNNKIPINSVLNFQKFLNNINDVFFDNSIILNASSVKIERSIKINHYKSYDYSFIDKLWALVVDNPLNNVLYDNLSIVVLNYNNLNIITKCLDMLIKYSKYYKYNIIVVDNNSTDGSFEFIRDHYKNVLLVKNSVNGCSSGRNLGVKYSNRKYIMFLDSDQYPNYFYWLHSYSMLMSNVEYGIIGWTGGWFNNKGYAYHVVDNFNFRYMPVCGLARCDLGYLGSGGMLIERDLFNEIEGFDINYDPTCYEDTDLSLKVRNEGYKMWYCPSLGITHIPHQTTHSGSEYHDKLIMEKGTYFVNKWRKINNKLLKTKI